MKLQAIRIGGLGIVSSPCETFVETGLAIKQASPLQPTFVIELANGYNGYLPTPEQHQLGGYETWRARSSYLEIDAATKIQSTLLSLLREVASGSEFVVAGQPTGKTSSALAPPLAGEARPDEPLRGEFSLDAAVACLDDAALTWQRDKKCFACHSNYAFLETRPLVSWKTPIHDELRAKLEELAANPRQVSFRVMEGVMAACVLAQNDALTTGKQHPVTRQVLDYMWTLQRARRWLRLGEIQSATFGDRRSFRHYDGRHRCRRGPGWLRGNTDGPGRVGQNPPVPDAQSAREPASAVNATVGHPARGWDHDGGGTRVSRRQSVRRAEAGRRMGCRFVG